MDLVPELDDSELRKFADSLKGRGADRTLRLFACWCARQLKPNNIEWLTFIDTAEKFAQGKVSTTRFVSINNDFRNVAAAAFTIGWKQHSSSAAICLAVDSTLAPEANTAAVQAAMWQRRYEMLVALHNSINSEEVEIADNALANAQVQQLRKMSRIMMTI